MRISDWSSDVCSSDLHAFQQACVLLQGIAVEALVPSGVLGQVEQGERRRLIGTRRSEVETALDGRAGPLAGLAGQARGGYQLDVVIVVLEGAREALRSEERRVGKECGSTCRFRWSPVP